LESIFSYLVTPDDSSSTLAHKVLTSVTKYSPTKWSYCRHCQAARFFLGDTLADSLQLESSVYDYWYLQLFFLFITLMNFIIAPFAIKERSFLHTKTIASYRVVISKHTALKSLSTECPFDNFKSL
jgi:hypothetical protein